MHYHDTARYRGCVPGWLARPSGPLVRTRRGGRFHRFDRRRIHHPSDLSDNRQPPPMSDCSASSHGERATARAMDRFARGTGMKKVLFRVLLLGAAALPSPALAEQSTINQTI